MTQDGDLCFICPLPVSALPSANVEVEPTKRAPYSIELSTSNVYFDGVIYFREQDSGLSNVLSSRWGCEDLLCLRDFKQSGC